MASRDLTAQRVRELFCYDEQTGVLSRRVRIKSHPVGSYIGAVNQDGYLKATIDGNTVLIHRVIWLYMTGEHPPDMIDHRNGIKTDNAWANLRLANNTENQQNRWLPPRTKRIEAPIGVTFERGKWRVRIRSGGRKHHIGFFVSQAEAAEAYMAAKQSHHPFVKT